MLDALNELLAPHIFPPRADGVDARQCPSCGEGRLSLKVGKFGAFIGCSHYPDCRFTRQLTPGENGGADNAARPLGKDPETGLEVTVRSGRFGPYLQLGEGSKEEKPKRASLPKGLSPEDIDLDRALGLLRLPREIGRDPESGEPIVAGVGRFGPYVQLGKTYANLDDGDDVLTIGLNRAVTLIAEKKLNPGRGRRFGPEPGRDLGEHPDRGGPVVAKKGRYGPYVSHEGINATLPSDKTPETVTLDEAVALIDARIASGATAKRRAPARKAAAKSGAEGKTKKKSNAAKKANGPDSDAAEKPVKKPAKRARKKPAAVAKEP